MGWPIEIRSVDGVITLTDLDPQRISIALRNGSGVLVLPEVALDRDNWERTGTVAFVPVSHIVKVQMSTADTLASSTSASEDQYFAEIGIGGDQDGRQA